LNALDIGAAGLASKRSQGLQHGLGHLERGGGRLVVEGLPVGQIEFRAERVGYGVGNASGVERNNTAVAFTNQPILRAEQHSIGLPKRALRHEGATRPIRGSQTRRRRAAEAG
jgi:hypothetical protein